MSFARPLKTRLLQLPSHNDLHTSAKGIALARSKTLLMLSYSLRHSSRRRKALRHLRGLRDTRTGSALVVASGPSASRIPEDYLIWFQAIGGYVIGLNGFASLGCFRRSNPDAIVMADPLYFHSQRPAGVPVPHSVDSDLARLEGFAGELFVPEEYLACDRGPLGRAVGFDFRGLEGLSRSIDPTRPRGYSGLTSYAALSLALFLGFSPVYVVGFDNSFAQDIEVDDLNRVVVRSQHAYEEEPRFWTPPTRVSSILGNVAQCQRDLDLFADRPVINLGGQLSLVDCFARASPWSPSQQS